MLFSTVMLFHKTNKVSFFALLLFAIASVLFTYNGLIEEYGTVDSWSSVRPFLQTMVSGVIGLIGWWFFSQTIPIAKPEELKKLITGLCVFLVLIFSTSTYYGSIGIAGNQARHEIMNRNIENFEQTFTKLIRQKREVEILLPVVTGGKKVFMSIVQREKHSGLLSGRRGTGSVSSTVQGIVDGFTNLENILNTDIEKTERLYKKGNNYIEDFRNILNDRTITTGEKYDQIAGLYVHFRKLFLDLEKSIIPTFTSQVERLDNMYLISNDDETRQLFAVLQKPIAESKTLILETAAGLKTRPVSIPSFKIVGSLEAVLMTPAYSYPSLIYSFGCDFLAPLGLLMILYYLASGIRNPQRRQNGSPQLHHQQRPIATMPLQRKYATKGKDDSTITASEMQTHGIGSNNKPSKNSSGDNSKSNGGNGKQVDLPTDF